MRVAAQIALVLMGGGALATGVQLTSNGGPACRSARAQGDPNANAICGASSTGYSGHGGGWWGRTAGAASTSSTSTSGWRSVMRGGFGWSGLHFGGFHG